MTDRPHTGGDMTDGGVARAHLETPEEIAAIPTDIEVPAFTQEVGEVGADSEPSDGVTLANRAEWPHAKVVLLMVSVGGDDATRSYEEFVADIKRAVVESGVAKAATETGGYYIVNGKVCLPGDYDPATRDFKEGATAPPWAGGPTKTKTLHYAAAAEEPSGETEFVRPVRANKPKATPTPVPDDASPEERVRALAEGMNREVTSE